MILITLLVISVTFTSNEINDFDLTLNDGVLFEQFKEVFKKI